MNTKSKQSLTNGILPFREIGGEGLLQFIWQFGYFNKAELATTNGEPLSILFAGSINKNQGPDFTNGRIKIGDTTLAGRIELHTKTSEWKRHRHEADHQYKNVILHVVFHHDEKVNDIPVLELEPRISTLLLQTYAVFMNNTSFIACGEGIKKTPSLTWASWKERLVIERLARKSERVLQTFAETNGHWEETFWRLLARAFGTKVNGDAFEEMARSIPVNIIAKHKSSIHQLESLLFGQAGLLKTDFEDEYPKLLQREYNFLKAKYFLTPSAQPVLFLRMRPGNFPTVRLAQLAMLLQKVSHLFSKIIEAESVVSIKDLFCVTANDYWHYHYLLDQPSAYKKKVLGTDAINNLIINTVIPIVFAYGHYHKEEKYKDKALRWLEAVPAESNSIINEFAAMEIISQSAYDTQALLELKNEYCSQKKCLDCSVGNFLLREAATTYSLTAK